MSLTDTAAATELRREVEIDTKLGELWQEAAGLRLNRENAKLSLASTLGIRPHYVTKTRREVTQTVPELKALAAAKIAELEAGGPNYRIDEIKRAVERWDDNEARLAANRQEAAPLETIYEDEQWSRFFLVQNAGGHIHSSMQCSTCNFRTSFGWLPDLSGLTEEAAVAEHGPLLCSVCYPSAPVEWTLGPVKEAPKNECPGSRTRDHDSSGIRYYSPRAKCDHCQQTVSVTSAGNLRAHKKEQS